MFDAILIEKPEDGDQTVSLTQLEPDALPEGDVRVAVAYSTLNYKDALAITGRGPVVRKFPMVPGIDFAGTVIESSHPDFSEGDRVVLNGWGVGETHWGGLAGEARVKGEQDPGYGETSKMLGESAVCLALDGADLGTPGGILTPASSMGMTLVDRLRQAGMTFEVRDAA